MNTWKVLLVDDEKDVHSITSLVLRTKKWRKRRFELTSAYSEQEARAVLKTRTDFHVAILDVVMEREDSGLRLCQHIRAELPGSVRIILRTGQPGLAPEEAILNDYDIDYYLAKSDATPGKLFSVLRACLRSSQDISTLLAYGRQLQSFTRTLQSVSTVKDLVVFMREALNFLELKHSAVSAFNFDLDSAPVSFIVDTDRDRDPVYLRRISDAMLLAHEQPAALSVRSSPREGVARQRACPGPELGLDDNVFVVPFIQRSAVGDNTPRDVPAQPIRGGLMFSLDSSMQNEKAVGDYLADALLFIENWCIAYGTLRLRERLAQEQMMRERMYFERMESIATMVAGVAHELNTPLGIARTSSSMMVELAAGLVDPELDNPEDKKALSKDMNSACDLLGRNLDRAQRLIKSFKELSTSQLTDEREVVDIAAVLNDVLETSRPQFGPRGLDVSLRLEEDVSFTWTGYAGHLSQVILNLLQNTMRYAYAEGEPGKVDIEVTRVLPRHFCITYRDYGKGVAPEILPRIFEPFVTSSRGSGGTGLGLAISRNIVVNMLGGTLSCTSTPDQGATFIIEIPDVATPDEANFMGGLKGKEAR
jgi:signal transduction histidine kinase/CheY-like chemotaxis protein